MPKPVDPDEPNRVASATAELKLEHVVVTSVTRDDLQDGGANQFARTASRIRDLAPKSTIEFLTPDFKNCEDALETIARSRPDILNHNIETVPRLYSAARPNADYQGSLALLKRASAEFGMRTKSGLMVGLGETEEELMQVFSDLADNDVSILTIGQYLSPSVEHLPVVRYYEPHEFDRLGMLATQAGIGKVISAPLARSSYLADASV
jgi:lipoic acid synthetase